ncbi:MAG: Fic family protein [Sulfurimonas sp.]|nr:Fic family protein [Sulfurimonas sp.]
MGVEANKIQHKLYQLMDDLKTWTEFWDYKKTATKLHHMLVIIHPFLNGNGRWARLVTDIWLASQGHETLEWGNDNLVDINDDRSEYIQALKEADKGDLNRLQRFMFPEK